MQGGIPIVDCDCFSHAGQVHTRHHLPNEDHIWTVRRDRLVSTAVCDGAGGLGQGGAAAQLVSRLTAQYLWEEFAVLYTMDPDAARRRLARVITTHLQNCADARAVPERQLATTILAAAMDDRGRCLCLHLGDGIILGRKAGHPRFDVVSSPRNGLTGRSTYLTMNCNLWTHLRFQRWWEPEPYQLLLMTDGAMEHLADRTGSAGWHLTVPFRSLQDLQAHLHARSPEDDYSCALLSRKMKI